MSRRQTILSALRKHKLDAVFWGLLAFALAVGGADAVSGLPVLANILLPQGLSRAHADQPIQRAYASFAEPIGTPSKYAPQVLQPVQSGFFPDWLVHRGEQPAPPAAEDHRPKIAIVIDDMGGDVEQSERAIALPDAISLSFLPYPATAPSLARSAHRQGHEILVHVPMEPLGTADPGPNALRVGLDPSENLRRLDWNLSRFSGYDGINNHEGSRFTASREALIPVMGALAARHLFFLDSRTAPATQVLATAKAFGVESAARDVFLDDTDRPDAIDAQLRIMERTARTQGVVIAIGHPRRYTLDALWRWCGEVNTRGFVLIPVHEAIRLKQLRDIREASLTRH